MSIFEGIKVSKEEKAETASKDTYTKAEIMQKLGWLESPGDRFAEVRNTSAIESHVLAVRSFVDILFDKDIDRDEAFSKFAADQALFMLKRILEENAELRSRADL